MSQDIFLMNVRSWEDLRLSMIRVSLLRTMENILFQEKCNRQLENNAIINNMVDDILINETQKVSAERKAPGFLNSGCNENDLYQVDKISLEESKEKIERRRAEFEYKLKNPYGFEK